MGLGKWHDAFEKKDLKPLYERLRERGYFRYAVGKWICEEIERGNHYETKERVDAFVVKLCDALLPFKNADPVEIQKEKTEEVFDILIKEIVTRLRQVSIDHVSDGSEKC